MKRCLFVLTLLGLAACGGAVDSSAETAPQVKKLDSTNLDALPVGSWNLVSLERDDAFTTDVHDVLQLEVRADGSLVARRCGKTYYEPGAIAERCADATSYDCFYGTVARDADGWRVDLPDLPTTSTSQERIAEPDGEKLKIRYIMPKSPSGSFVREPEQDKASITSVSTSNCKG